jgi:hypothetical protein
MVITICFYEQDKGIFLFGQEQKSVMGARKRRGKKKFTKKIQTDLSV